MMEMLYNYRYWEISAENYSDIELIKDDNKNAICNTLNDSKKKAQGDDSNSQDKYEEDDKEKQKNLNNQDKYLEIFIKYTKDDLLNLIIEYTMFNVKSEGNLSIDMKERIAKAITAQEPKSKENKVNDLGRTLMLMNIFSKSIDKEVLEKLSRIDLKILKKVAMDA
ncbi:hypothetical protein CWI42_060040 [Ordospora colligata]|uniref:Uncharacterized protein n=1 Tax=Ordospora colligata OC4 TaxID=1354746 RepID=A0A0B2UEI5_9MICR|nr:uncharacterized protein M896_060040 [Ordospora colligata OC4]KHN69506.1 hypothetical protein M896_060040 [Ordospora colligata OC4]TBU15326.1 hypothetical protein CWI41_060030 [Ordospora colligata]TBU18522.1 hypothetical protein CWI42_060040 [Ordospora colligata]